MRRRAFLAALVTAGAAGTAGCGTVRSETTLSDPTVHTESSGRRSITFTSNSKEIGSLGVDGDVTSGTIDLSTEIWHRSGTNVKSVALRVWMRPTETESVTEVAVVSPVQGDSSPPPSVSLYSPRRGPGTMIEIDDLDDLEDETISTLDLIVRPGSTAATTLVIETTIELTNSRWASSGYTLDGQLRLEFPELREQ